MTRHDRDAADRFDRWAATYGEDRIASWFAFYQDLALSKLRLAEDGWLLDVGCGPGGAVQRAARSVARGRACGIDVSPKMIEKARDLSAGMANVEFRLASSESIPYPDAAFDAVVCTCSFHHYGRPAEALADIHRVMKPGATFVILDSARDVSLPIWLQDRFRRYFEQSHVTYYTTGEMRGLLSSAGFRIVGDFQTFRRYMHLGKVFTGLMLAECRKS